MASTHVSTSGTAPPAPRGSADRARGRLAELDGVDDDRHDVGVHREETPGHVRLEGLPDRGPDGHAARPQDREHRGVSLEDSHLAVGRWGRDHARLALPDRAVWSDEVDV